jgi:hypothetical protein
MKLFHISDVLSVTTGRLVSSRHIEGVYDILNFLTGDNLYTHQLPRAMDECEPWLRTQYPQLFPDNPVMKDCLTELENLLEADGHDKGLRKHTAQQWVDDVRTKTGLPEMLPIYELGADMHTHIDPVEELKAMVGDKKVIVVDPEDLEED